MPCALASLSPARGGSRRLAILVLGLVVGGCEDVAISRVDGGIGRRLEIVAPPGAQIGLRYGRSIELGVRARLDDEPFAPIGEEPIRFAIFDDPAGSTLGRDVVNTDSDGLARVTLTAGQKEGSFRVRASATGATDVEFAVSTSMLEFVELDVALTDPLSPAGGHALTALLYTDRICASIQPTPKPEGAARSLTAAATAAAKLAFVNLLSRSYALVGRVDGKGGLLAFGCIDIDRGLAPPGAHLDVPIGMHVVTPAVLGGFALTSTLRTARAERTDGLFASVDRLDRCEGHLGQLLLDELLPRLSPARGAALAALRAPPQLSVAGASTVDCRPGMLAAAVTLDVELDALFSQAAVGAARADLLADLDALLASGSLRSRLTLVAGARRPEDGIDAPQRLLAEHRADHVTMTLGSAQRSYDLAQLGLPILAALGIDAARESGALLLAQHELPIGVPALWGEAFGQLSLGLRLPALLEQSFAGWVSATVAAAQRNTKIGCAAVEDLLCERSTPVGCAGSLLTACTESVAVVGARLDGAFHSKAPLRLRGSALVVDDDGDLIGDRLTPGAWREEGALASKLSFAGERAAP